MPLHLTIYLLLLSPLERSTQVQLKLVIPLPMHTYPYFRAKLAVFSCCPLSMPCFPIHIYYLFVLRVFPFISSEIIFGLYALYIVHLAWTDNLFSFPFLFRVSIYPYTYTYILHLKSIHSGHFPCIFFTPSSLFESWTFMTFMTRTHTKNVYTLCCLSYYFLFYTFVCVLLSRACCRSWK